MKRVPRITRYSAAEERINIFSHALGFALSIAALALLVTFASLRGTVWHIVSFSIFGGSLVVLYAASTIYHSSRKDRVRLRLKVFDHASIYVLIAGTYTPFTLVALGGAIGWTLFGVSWGLALAGIVLKLFFTGRYALLSTFMYVAMGWIVIFAVGPLVRSLPTVGFIWLLAGGLSYTFGAVVYSIRKIAFNHAIFHSFVLLGSFCHFVAVFFYLLPGS